ncbi:MAG: ShlB/FhaC/HecB family hemolysin secretion/activation protein [Pseudomonadota bacterium]
MPHFKIASRVFLLASLVFIIINNSAFALTADQEAAVNQLNKKLQRDNERLFEEERRKIDEQELLKPAPKIEVIKPESSLNLDDKKCFTINEIKLTGSESLLKQERAEIIKSYQNKCLSLADIEELRVQINNFYIDKGYIMSRVYLAPNQNLKSGILEFEIKEGEIEEISINGNRKLSDRTRILTAFPYDQQSFNLRDVEQGLDQINRLQSSNATMKILPGSEGGKSIVEIVNDEKRTTSAKIGYDNLGQESTGERRRILTLQQDNLLMLNDNLYINYTHDQEGNDQIRYNQNLYTSFSVPYGYWLYQIAATDSKYLNTVKLPNSTLKSSGETQSYSLEINRVIQRGKRTNTSLSGNLTKRNTASFADGYKLEVGSRKLTTLDLGLKHRLNLNATNLSFGANYVRGLSALNALQDPENLKSDDPKAQFEMLQFNAALYKKFQLFTQDFNFSSNISGQISKDALYSSEQISIGDFYSVRGFKNNSISSDNGGYIRNELSMRMPKITEKFYIDRALQGLSFFVGYDYGMVRSKPKSDASLNGKNRAYLSGFAAGVKHYDKYFDYSFTYAESLSSPSFVREKNREIYFNVSFSI